METPEIKPLEIDWDDLADVTPIPPVQTTRRVTTSGAPAGPPLSGSTRALPVTTGTGRGGVLDRLMPTAVWQGLLAGLIGGVLGMLAGEFVTDWEASDFFDLLLSTATWTACIAAVATPCIVLVLALLNQTTAGLGARLTFGSFVGAVCAFVSGAAAQYVYSYLLFITGADLEFSMGPNVLARSIAWAFAGLGIGVGQAVLSGSGRRVSNGLLGGLLGGALGGLLFDPIGEALWTVGINFGNGAVMRLIGLAVMGLSIGGSIGLVSRARRQAMLKVVGGPFFGKEFLIDTTETLIGRVGGCHVVLFKDPAVAPQHAVVRTAGNGYRLEALAGSPVHVNGRNVHSHLLRQGDSIQLGGTVLRFESR